MTPPHGEAENLSLSALQSQGKRFRLFEAFNAVPEDTAIVRFWRDNNQESMQWLR